MSWRSQREAALHRDQDPVPAPPLAPAPTPVQILALALALAQCPGPDLVLGPCPPPLRLLLAAPVLEAEALLLAKGEFIIMPLLFLSFLKKFSFFLEF